MDPAEISYEIHDKEMLAVVAAFKRWRRYLEIPVHQVQVYTKHKNLEYFTRLNIYIHDISIYVDNPESTKDSWTKFSEGSVSIIIRSKW